MIFIIMEITRVGYQKALNSFLPRKYKFIERVEIKRGPGIRMGLFICEILIITNDGFHKNVKDECKDRINIGDVISFWPFIQCLGKRYDLIGLEKDIQMIYTELTGLKSVSRDITLKFEIK